MYVDLGHGVFLREKEIIGIFDLDKTTVSKNTRDFLSRAEKDGKVENAFENIPNSYVVADGKIYLMQPATATLRRRANG